MSKRFPDIRKARLHLLMLGFLFLVCQHYIEEHNGGLGLELPTNLLSWIAISIIVGLGLYRIAISGQVIYTRLTLWFLLCVGLLSIPALFPGSTLINESPVHLGLLGGLLFYIAMQQFRPGFEDMNLILMLILLSALIEAIIGWHNYLGISYSSMGIGGPGSQIPFGAIRQRNVLSSLFATGLILSAWFIDPRRRPTIPKVTARVFTYLVIFTPLILMPLIVLLKSRVGWLGGMVAFTLVLPSLWALKSNHRTWYWGLALVAGLLVVPLMDQFSSQVEVVPAEKLNFAGPRNYFYQQIIDLALEKPVVGHGFGNFEREYNLISAEGYANGDYDSPAYANLSHPHNEILYWWIEGGILGLAGFLLAAWVVLRNILRTGDFRKFTLLLGLFFPIVLHTQTEMPFNSSVGHWIIFLLLVLLVDVETEQFKKKKLRYGLLPGVLAFVIPLVVTAFMLTTLQSGRLLYRVERDMEIDVSVLERIQNPVVWQDRLMWDMNFGMLALAVYQNRPELALNYINWATQIIKRKPRAGYYQFLVVAYKVVGDEAQARKIQEEAEFRFPDKEFNFELNAFQGIERKDINDVQVNMIEE